MREQTLRVGWSHCLRFNPVLGRWAELGPPHQLGVCGQVCYPLGINSYDSGAPVPDLSSPRVDPSLDPSGCCWQVAEEGATPHGRREGSSDEKLSFVSPGPCHRTCILKGI